jgi:hypothetical protein
MSINYTDANSIFFTIARMNPPTPGHLNIIQKLIEVANERGVSHVYIILSKTNNNNENPISCPEKIEVLGDAGDVTETMINALKATMIAESPDNAEKIRNTQVHTICVTVGSPFSPIGNLIFEMESKGVSDINLFVVVGSDRADMVDNITDQYYFKNPNVQSIGKFILPREDVTSVGLPKKGMNEYKTASKSKEGLANLLKNEQISDIVTANAMSASFVRNMVKFSDGNDADAALIKQKFFELYSPYLDNEKINKLYNSILTGITELGPNTTPSKPSPPVRYKDNLMIKGISSEFPITKASTRKGGRKGSTKFPMRYLPKNLTKADKKKQFNMLIKSKKLYKKHKYYTRKNVDSYKHKKSQHVINACKIYNVKNVTPNKELAKKTGCKLSALNQIVKKGEGAYYSSGSRPNQSAKSWGLARLASSLTAGKAAAVDFDIIDKGCDHKKKAFILAKKSRKKNKYGHSKTKKTTLKM